MSKSDCIFLVSVSSKARVLFIFISTGFLTLVLVFQDPLFHTFSHIMDVSSAKWFSDLVIFEHIYGAIVI